MQVPDIQERVEVANKRPFSEEGHFMKYVLLDGVGSASDFPFFFGVVVARRTKLFSRHKERAKKVCFTKVPSKVAKKH